MIKIETLHKEQCFGCGACAQSCRHAAISMKPDAEGFCYPAVDTSSCVECGLCEAACPAINLSSPQVAAGSHADTLPDIYAFRHRDDSILASSSSGGAFTAIAEFVLSQQGVVMGAAFTSEMEVRHTAVTTAEGLSALRGSKYAQSRIDGAYYEARKLLKQGRWLLFTGTPCQVAGLKGYLRHDYETLLTCDLLCRGVASPMLFKEWLDFVQSRLGKTVTDYHHRDKSRGWGLLSPKLIFADGTQDGGQDAWLWHRIHSSGLVNRPSCYHCPYSSTHREGDFSIGDFWGIEKSHPEQYDTRGVSLLMVNSEKARSLMPAIATAGIITAATVEECLQPCLQAPLEEPQQRQAFWADHSMMSFDRLCRKYFLWGLANRIKLKLRSIFSKLFSI